MEYTPSQQHGYGSNKISEESPTAPYHQATLYGQENGGYKIADAYQTQPADSHDNSAQDYSSDDHVSLCQHIS